MTNATTCARRRVERLALVCAVAVLLALRLPFLPATLEDIDSVNFDLGVHDFDPVHHQPHPPGFAVYVFLARLVHPWFDSHAAGLAFLSVLAGALAVVPLYLLLRRLTSPVEAALASTLTLFNPIVWFNSVRPMSDLTGFAAVTTAQWLLVASFDHAAHPARKRAVWLIGTMVAGLTIGIRLQAVWLVGPLLLFGLLRVGSWRAAAVTAGVFGAAMALWLVPLLVLSGGPSPLLASFSSMVAYSLPVEPLLTDLSIRRAAVAAADVFLGPWQTELGTVILVLAAAGAALLVRGDLPRLGWLCLLFLPYTVYHYVTQATPNLRYAIPIVPAVACLAAVALVRGTGPRPRLAVMAAGAAAIFASVVTLPALAAYASAPSPPFQALAALDRLNAPAGSIVVTGHHVFERYLQQVRGHDVLMPTSGARLTLMKYWQDGGQKPVLFFRQPGRTTLLLFGHERQELAGRWGWPAPVQRFMRGERPGRVELVRLGMPRWFAEDGFLISDEAGPVEAALKAPPRLRVRPSTERRALVVSGSLHGAPRAHLRMKLRGEQTSAWTVEEQFTVRALLEPGPPTDRYVPMSFESTAPVLFTDVWIEPADRAFIRPTRGFYLPERDPDAALFRWMAPHAVATAYLPGARARVTIEGWMPADYYRLPVQMSLSWNGRALGAVDITTPRFHIVREVTGSATQRWGELGFVVSQSFQPDTRQLNGDRRELSVRIYRLAIDEAP